MEIKTIHEYFLFLADGTSFFELGTEEARQDLLMNRVLEGLYNIQGELSFIPTEETAKQLKLHKMKLANTSTGFMIGLEVEERDQAYFPKITLKEGLRLSFQIIPKRASLMNFSNVPLHTSLPSIYYLSNDPDDSEKEAPYLSLAAEELESSKEYPMGSLAYQGPGNLVEAVEKVVGNEPGKWMSVPDNRYVNEQDRILVPHKFIYRFFSGQTPSQADITLRSDVEGRIKKISFASGQLSAGANVDFSTTDDGTPINPGRYQLVVKYQVNGQAFESRYSILIDSERYNPQALGVIDLVIERESSAFHLLHPDGSLKSSSNEPHPIFKILFKSRNTYWRYISNKERNLEAEPRAAPFLDKLGTGDKHLVSVQPRYFSAIPTLFQTDAPSTTGVNETVFLPNPTPEALRIEKDGRFYSNIYVGPLKNLIKDS